MTYLVKKGNKYGAVSQIYNGRSYHSKFEAGVAATLDLARKATDRAQRVVKVTPQYRVSLDVNGYHICNYIADFFVEYANGEQEIIEAKGFETDAFRMKWKLLEAIYAKEHPDIRLTVIKQQSWKRYK